MPDEHLSQGELADYWTPDVSAGATTERIEAHIFACADCARRLEATRTLIGAVSDAVRSGEFQAIITDTVLNRLARDGARVRTFTLEPGAVVPCAVWADDDVIVVRLRADFTGLEAVSLVTQLAGQEIDRVLEVPVRAAAGELLEAFSAAQLRQVPRAEIRLRVFGSRGGTGGDELIAEYVLDHAGAIGRTAPTA